MATKLKKEIVGLQKLKAELTNKLAALTKSNDELRNKNNNLQNTIAGLEKDKANLENTLAGMQCVATNSFLVETSKKKQEKLTAKAKRTKNVKVGFDVNQVGADDVTFKITSPDGKLLDSKTIKVAAVQT